MAKQNKTTIYSWMRNRNTLESLEIWEEMNNPNFKGNDFVTFKNQLVAIVANPQVKKLK